MVGGELPAPERVQDAASPDLRSTRRASPTPICTRRVRVSCASRMRTTLPPARFLLLPEKGPLSARAPIGGARAAAAATPGSPWPACLSFQSVTAIWALPPASLVPPLTLPPSLPGRARAPGNRASARAEGTAREPGDSERAGTRSCPSEIGGTIPSPLSADPAPMTFRSRARARRVPGAHLHPLQTFSFESSPCVQVATEPSLQEERSVHAKLTVGGGQSSAGGSQTLEAHAQSHQEQRFAPHLEARPSL